MPAVSLVSLSPGGAATLSVGTRLVRCRQVEKIAPQHGEKPYEQLVAESFDGPVLRLSQKLKLLEEADSRHIRRGDAIALIETLQAQLELAFAVPRPSKTRVFVRRFCLFVAAYALVAMAACLLLR
jgi:hypothetical protein